MTACASVCVRVKCSLTLSTCLSNELALQQHVRQDRKFQAQRDLQCLCKMHRCVELWSMECVRDKVRDTDSDYLMRKPSRCWLCAVLRYWNVVVSCFRFISFAENTSAALAPRADISQPILLLFFLFSCSWICLQHVASIFFRSQNLVAFERRQDWLKKAIFQRFHIFNQLPVRILNFWGNVFCGKAWGVS